MSFARDHGCERKLGNDRVTGVPVTQMTSFPTPSTHLYYEHPSFTSDNSTVVFRCQRTASRDSRWDLAACDVDGRNLRQVTDEDDADNFAIAADGPVAWYQRGTALWRVDLDTGERNEVGPGPDGYSSLGYSMGCVSTDGEFYFGFGTRTSDRMQSVVRYRTDGTESVVLVTMPGVIHLHASPGGHGVSYGGTDEDGEGRMYGMGYDGSNNRLLATSDLSHFTWVGDTPNYLGCGVMPDRMIHMREEGQAESTVIVEGSYFWHSGRSTDPDWTVADTNWPNEGIMLVNIRTRQYALVCMSDNSGGHPQLTHAHPSLSPDCSKVVYTSDCTGTAQVYVAEVTDRMRSRLATPQPRALPGGRLPDTRVAT